MQFLDPEYLEKVLPMEELFHTQAQVDKFLKTMEGATYRLKQWTRRKLSVKKAP